MNKRIRKEVKYMLEMLKVIFLGIVEGITEWLPISSTGHMILVDEFLKLNVTEEFKNLFFVVIHIGLNFLYELPRPFVIIIMGDPHNL